MYIYLSSTKLAKAIAECYVSKKNIVIIKHVKLAILNTQVKELVPKEKVFGGYFIAPDGLFYLSYQHHLVTEQQRLTIDNTQLAKLHALLQKKHDCPVIIREEKVDTNKILIVIQQATNHTIPKREPLDMLLKKHFHYLMNQPERALTNQEIYQLISFVGLDANQSWETRDPDIARITNRLIDCRLHARDFFSLCSRLKQNQLLTQESVDFVLQHGNVGTLLTLIDCLESHDLLTPANYQLLTDNYQATPGYAMVELLVKTRKILTQKLLLVLINYPDKKRLVTQIQPNTGKFLTADKIMILIAYLDSHDITEVINQHIWQLDINAQEFRLLLDANNNELIHLLYCFKQNNSPIAGYVKLLQEKMSAKLTHFFSNYHAYYAFHYVDYVLHHQHTDLIIDIIEQLIVTHAGDYQHHQQMIDKLAAQPEPLRLIRLINQLIRLHFRALSADDTVDLVINHTHTYAITDDFLTAIQQINRADLDTYYELLQQHPAPHVVVHWLTSVPSFIKPVLSPDFFLLTPVERYEEFIKLACLLYPFTETNHAIVQQLIRGLPLTPELITHVEQKICLDLFRYLLSNNESAQKTVIDYIDVARKAGCISEPFYQTITHSDNFLSDFICYHYHHYPMATLIDSITSNINTVPNWLMLWLMNGDPNHPLISHFLQAFSQLTSIEIFDSGRSDDTWWRLAYSLLSRLPEPRFNKTNRFEQLLNDNHDAFYPLMDSQPPLLAKQLTGVLGRTLLFNCSSEHEVLALKVIKEHEDHNDLTHEYHVTRFLYNHGHKLAHSPSLQLASTIPKPIGLAYYTRTELTTLLQQANRPADHIAMFHRLIGSTRTRCLVYIYKAEPAYFCYLHQPAIDWRQFAKANHTAISDFCLLLAHGVYFDRTADLFHNNEQRQRQDQGRYIVLANLLSPRQAATLLRQAPISFGSGRLHAWLAAIEWPNIRLGLADWGDYITLNDIQASSNWVATYFSQPCLAYQNKVSHFILANIFAEYQYILFLIAGRRGRALCAQLAQDSRLTPTQYHQQSTAIWLLLAEQIITNCIDMVDIFTAKSRVTIMAQLTKIVDKQRLARQMQFWLTTAYIEPISANQMPNDIYPAHTTITINNAQFRQNTFHPTLGFSINGVDPDLGAVNGQEPIKEANKLFYWTCNFIVAAYLGHCQLRTDLQQLMIEPDIRRFHDKRQHNINYLSAKSYHLAQVLVCQYRCKKISNQSNDYRQLEHVISTHKQSAAVLTIQGFWRQHRVKSRHGNVKATTLEASQTPL